MSIGTQNFFVLFDPLLLALTNGYVQTIFACYSAVLVSKTGSQEGYTKALGSLIALSLTLGISVGGVLQIPFAKLNQE